jgi:hypothetical protein
MLAQLEEQLFGCTTSKSISELYIQEKDFVPLLTGVPNLKYLKSGPKHIINADQFEPLYIHQENMLEQCLNREADRIANDENLMNRVVYDSVNESKISRFDSTEEQKE